MPAARIFCLARQRNLRLQIQRRMAAGEDQPQTVVFERRVAPLVQHRERSFTRRGLLAEQGIFFGANPCATQAVNRSGARCSRQPGGGVLGHSALGPAVERLHESVLQRLLGQIKVTAGPNQRRDDPAVLTAKDVLDTVTRIWHR